MNRRAFATGLLALPFARQVAAAPEKQLRAVLMGVERYPQLGTLPYCADDVKLLGHLLGGLGYEYNAVAVDSSLGGLTLKEGVAALEKAVESCREDDRLLLYFSGHGGTIGERQYLFFSDTNLSGSPVNGLPMEGPGASLETIMRPCKARERILIVDACRAPVKGNRGIFKPIDASFAKGAGAALRGKPNQTDIRKAVMFASQRGEVAVPAESGHHSFYTGLLLNGLKVGHRRVEDLQAYLSRNTPRHRPQPDLEGDGKLWIAPAWGRVPPRELEAVRGTPVYLTNLTLLRYVPNKKPQIDEPCRMGGRSYPRAVTVPILGGREVAAYYVPQGAVWFEATWGVSDTYQGDRTGVAAFEGINRFGAKSPLGVTGVQAKGSAPEKIRVEVRDAHQFCIRTNGAFRAPGDFFLGDAHFICR